MGGELLNLVGLLTGVLLYAMLLVMVVRLSRAPTRDALTCITAVLGLLWNVCALMLYEFPRHGIPLPARTIGVIGFGALGFLPAVVVHSVLRGVVPVGRGSRHLLLSVAYGASAIAGVLQIAAALAGAPIPSVAGMRVLTNVFVVLVVPLALFTRGQPGVRRALWVAALAIFAVSALHLSQFHNGQNSWPVELLGHHASIPLALAILYQDFPFAFADLFLKRALTLLTLIALAVFGVLGLRSLAPLGTADALTETVALCVSLSLVYPAIARAIRRFVDRIILRRSDYKEVRARLADSLEASETVTQALDQAATHMTIVFGALASWAEVQVPRSAPIRAPALVLLGREDVRMALESTNRSSTGTEACAVHVPTGDTPTYLLVVGNVDVGRRLLSDDVEFLEEVATTTARRVDLIRVQNERLERQRHEQELRRLGTEAELTALRAQINPHFLFNALTTIGYLIQTTPDRALDTLMRLTALLRGVLRSDGDVTTLDKELELVTAYLEIERARFERRLIVVINVPNNLRELHIPPLILQPLVENAIKHGISPLAAGGEVHVVARLDDDDALLRLTVRDTGRGATASMLDKGRRQGLGLRNVERRLELHYGKAARMAFHSEPHTGTTVELSIPISRSSIAQVLGVGA